MESRSEKFKRVATKRTNELLEKIRILGNCSNKSTYEYTEEDVIKIFKSLEKQLETMKAKFSNKKSKFSL
ncbi:hypothetical protein [Candidatus Methylopumilus universalis]|uniref:hypothetical protein n=1 Tax=Candidatus Methylopumilus universalis TaxID=2588536 RepID=UPI00111F1649|nr:hypothetical protein [Candidatus Methylopumilus universalis]QDC71725.1 hypothetical protein FIT75_02505 [Candidatus Methylopumilus universalis]